MFHVMEHLYDPRAYLRAAHGLLAPDGRLVVQVPNAASWQARLLGRAWNGADIPRHLTNFRGRDLEKMIESAGFEVLRRKYFSLRDNPAGLASSLAPSLDPMARRVRRVTESGGARLAKDLAVFLAGSGIAAIRGGGSGVRSGLDGDDRGSAAMTGVYGAVDLRNAETQRDAEKRLKSTRKRRRSASARTRLPISWSSCASLTPLTP